MYFKISTFCLLTAISISVSAREWCEVSHSSEPLRNKTNHTYVSNFGAVDDQLKNRCSDKNEIISAHTNKSSDSDSDGVADSADRCANTPSGAQVNLFGCEKTVTSANDELIINVKFASGSDQINTTETADLQALADALTADPALKIQVTGHTDATGASIANIRLSEARAKQVKAFLTNKGIAAERVTAIGLGSQKPTASNETAIGRAENRRITVERQ